MKRIWGWIVGLWLGAEGVIEREERATEYDTSGRPIHNVWRSGDWQPCWCASKHDHSLGREVSPLGKFQNIGVGHQVRVASAPEPGRTSRGADNG